MPTQIELHQKKSADQHVSLFSYQLFAREASGEAHVSKRIAAALATAASNLDVAHRANSDGHIALAEYSVPRVLWTFNYRATDPKHTYRTCQITFSTNQAIV